MRRTLTALLAALALVLAVLQTAPTGARCSHAAPSAPQQHACCPKSATAAHSGAEACTGTCCAHGQPLATAAFELPPPPLF
ncbi:MAG: hypothetical protein R3F59_37430, partial [Myxococcota bacterium]